MEQKKTGKWKLISRFLKGNVHMFVLVFIFSMLNTLFNALTPQIVRISVDSVIGGADWQLPGWIVDTFHLESIRQSGWHALLLAGVRYL